MRKLTSISLLLGLLLSLAPVWAADQKISARTAAGALDGTETLPVIQGGADRKDTVVHLRGTFANVATGSNTTATMTCGAGCSIVPSSTGVNAATAIRPKVVTINAGNTPYTGLTTDMLILCDTSAGAVTLTLPAATSKMVYHIKNLSTNSCTINRAGSDTIDGGTSAVLTVQYESIGIDSDGSATWEIF
jgi:hypothetical protein